MASNTPRLRLTERKRAAIIEAATQEFRTAGFEHTSMDSIAQRAGVSKRTVYNHFPSKEDLFAAIIQALKDRCNDVTQHEFDPEAPLDEQLTEIGRCAISFFASEEFQCLARVLLPRLLQSPELARTVMGAPHSGIVNWIEAAQAAGRLDVPNPKWAGRQFLGLLNSVVFWPQLISGEEPLSEADREAVLADAVATFLARYTQ